MRFVGEIHLKILQGIVRGMLYCSHKDKDNEIQCKGKCKYGSYCYKHRSEYLVREGMIIESRFTGFAKDYLIQDLRNYCKRHRVLYLMALRIIPGTNTPITLQGFESSIHVLKKKDIFSIVAEIMRKVEIYDSEDSQKHIVKIQSSVRGFLERCKSACHNSEDFFTFESLRDIPSQYYFRYRDTQGFQWGFDVRSLKKLIDMGYANPYTLVEVPVHIIQRVNIMIQSLLVQGESIVIKDDIVKDKTTQIKHKVVDLFSKMEQSGYSCDISWFLDLNIHRLQELYKQLEDMWNYRLQLPREMKIEISPPLGRIFITPMSTILQNPSKEYLQEKIIDDVSTFSRPISESSQKLGYMYFIICLGYVSQRCSQTYGWLAWV